MNAFRAMVIVALMATAGTSFAQDATFVGSESCRDCHEKEYSNYMKYSKKAHSYESIKQMEKKLTREEFISCFECHTTGYGQKGGFISESETPMLKDAGCEVCHGPGSLHVESEDPDEIQRQVSIELCNSCHDSSRVEAFNYTPLIYGGAH